MVAMMKVLILLFPLNSGKKELSNSEEISQEAMAMLNFNTTCAYVNTTGSPFLTVSASPSSLFTGSDSTVSNCQYCHALVLDHTVVSQGCWAQPDGCSTPCTLSYLFPPSLVLKVRYPDMQFCCCSGDKCNQAWHHPRQGGVGGGAQHGWVETPSRVLSGVEIVLLSMAGVLVVLIVILTVLVTRPVPVPPSHTQYILQLPHPGPHTITSGWSSLESLLEEGMDNG